MGNILIVVGIVLLGASMLLPWGEQEAFAKRDLRFVHEDSRSDSRCERVYRGELVKLKPSRNDWEVRLASDPDCIAQKYDFSTLPRRPSRSLPPYIDIVGFQDLNGNRIDYLNARYEPDVSNSQIENELQIARRINVHKEIEPKYLVTGEDNLPWLEAEIPGLGVVYLKCNRLKIRLANGRIAQDNRDFCAASASNE